MRQINTGKRDLDRSRIFPPFMGAHSPAWETDEKIRDPEERQVGNASRKRLQDCRTWSWTLEAKCRGWGEMSRPGCVRGGQLVSQTEGPACHGYDTGCAALTLLTP